MTEQNSINKQSEDLLVEKSSGDPHLNYKLTGTKDYAIGIDDSDADKLKITDGSDPSTGSEIISVDPTSSNAVKFNNAYQFPTADGSANYVLTTNGAGVASWQANSATGKIVQQVRTSTNSYTSTTATIPDDDTIPQQTEGTQLFSLAITPTNASNILVFDFYAMHDNGGVNNPAMILALFQDATANAIFAAQNQPPFQQTGLANFKYYMTAGTTSSTTFKLRYGAASSTTGTIYINGNTSSRLFGGTSLAIFVITEISV